MSERRRLAPDERRSQLLDVAKAIVEDDGVARCTVDAVSTRAGVTAALVHRYFGTRLSLLDALYGREHERYQEAVRDGVRDARSFEEVVRVFVAANFDLLSDATAIGRLRGVAELESLHHERQPRSERSAERILVRALAAEYEVDHATTEFVLRLGSAASIEAGSLAAARRVDDRDAHIDQTVRFILAGVEAITGPGVAQHPPTRPIS